MRHAGGRYLVLASILAIVAIAFVGCLAGCRGRSCERFGSADGSGSAHVGDSLSFTIAGGADRPLMPGRWVPLDLELQNPHDFALTVSDLVVVVDRVEAPQADATHPCGPGDFVVRQVPHDVTFTIGASATQTLSSLGVSTSLWPSVGLPDTSVNQDGCKSAALTLSYSAASSRTP